MAPKRGQVDPNPEPEELDEQMMEDLYEVLDEAAAFLELNMFELVRDGVGKEIPTDDPRLETLAMTAFAQQMVVELLESEGMQARLGGGGREQVAFTAGLLGELVKEQVADLAGGKRKGVAWADGSDVSLLAFSSLAIAVGQLNAMLLAADLGDDLEAFMEDLGLGA